MKRHLKILGIATSLALVVALNCGAASLFWSGTQNGTNWDVGTSTNWNNGGPAVFNNGDSVTFNATASQYTNIWVATNVQPAAITVDTSTRSFIFSGTNPISGAGALAKLNSGTLILNNSNGFTGGLSLGGGQVTLNNNFGAGSGTITLSNGATLFANGTSPGNAIMVAAGANATIQNNGISPGFFGLLTSGDNTAVLNVNQTSLSANADQMDNFSGTVNVGAAGVRFSSTGLGSDGGTNCTFNLIGALFSRNQLTQNLGALTGSGTLQGAGGSAPGNSTIFIGAKNLNSIFNGTISEGSTSSHTSITKVGTGTLTLAGTNSYTGSTTVSSGTLTLTNTAVMGAGTSSNSTTITVSGGATLILAGAAPYNVLNLATNQTLKGGGIINAASVMAPAGATLAPGDVIGTLTVTGAVTSAGVILMELNRTNSTATNSQLKAAAIAITGGTLTIINLGPDLHTGDTFQLFSVANTGAGFATVSLPASNVLNTVQYVWTNQLAVNGSIQVLSTVSGMTLNPTNITAKLSGATLVLSWPPDHLGWYLQAQTNSLAAGLRTGSTNWVDVPNSSQVDSVTNVINPANSSVFYRLSSSP